MNISINPANLLLAANTDRRMKKKKGVNLGYCCSRYPFNADHPGNADLKVDYLPSNLTINEKVNQKLIIAAFERSSFCYVIILDTYARSSFP